MDEFTATVARAGFELKMQGFGDQEAAGETLRKAFPGCSVTFVTKGFDEQFDEDIDKDGH